MSDEKCDCGDRMRVTFLAISPEEMGSAEWNQLHYEPPKPTDYFVTIGDIEYTLEPTCYFDIGMAVQVERGTGFIGIAEKVYRMVPRV